MGEGQTGRNTIVTWTRRASVGNLLARFHALFGNLLQYRHLIPAPVDRASAGDWFYKHPCITCQENKPSTSVNHVASESRLLSIVRLSMSLCPGNWVAIGSAVVYHAQASHVFSAGIMCRHCRRAPVGNLLAHFHALFGNLLPCFYSADIQFLHQSTGRLPVPGCETPMDNVSKNKPSTSVTHVACESRLLSIERLSMSLCPGNWVAIGSAVVYHAQASHVFSAGIMCRHCRRASVGNLLAHFHALFGN